MAIQNTASSDNFYNWRVRHNKISAFFNDAGGDHRYTQNYSEESVNSVTGSMVTAGGVGIANNISVDGFVGVTPSSAIRISTGLTSDRPVTANAGMFRYNTTYDKLEYWDELSDEWKLIGIQLEDNDQDTKITVDTDDFSDEDTVRIYTGNAVTRSTERITVNNTILVANVDTRAIITIGDSTNQTGSQTNAYVVDRRSDDNNHTLDPDYTTNEFYGYLKIPVNDDTGPFDTEVSGNGVPGMIRFDPDRGFEGYISANVWAGLGGLIDSAHGQDTFATAYGANNPNQVVSSGDDDSTLDMIRFWIGNSTPNSSREALRIDRRIDDNSYSLDEEYPTTEVYGFFRVPANDETGPTDSGVSGNGVPGMIRFDPTRGFEGYLSANVWAGLGGLVDSADGQDTFATAYGANVPTSVLPGGDDDSTLDMIRFWIGNTTPDSSREALRIDRRSVDNNYTLNEEYPTTEVYGFFRVPVTDETGPGDTGVTSNGVPGMIRFDTTRGFEGYMSSNTWLGLGGVIDADQDTKITADTFIPSDEDHLRFYVAGNQKASVNSTITFIDTNVRITGNLQVTGTTSTIGATNLSVQDNLIYLNGPGDLDTTGNTAVATFWGYFSGTSSTSYKVEIDDDTSSPNKFKWYKNTGSGYVVQATNVDITGENQSLELDVRIRFKLGTTGYTLGDIWETTVEPINVDLGIVGNYNDGLYQHAGLFRDASDSGKWKFFDSYTPEPDAATNIDTGHASFSLADLSIGGLYVSANSRFQDTTDSSSSITGSVVLSGGLGVGKKLYVGDSFYVESGAISYFQDTTESTVPSAGSVRFSGGISVAKNIISPGIHGANTTSALKIPGGTTAQRGTGAPGLIRWNSSVGIFEGYNADTTLWELLGSGNTTYSPTGDINMNDSNVNNSTFTFTNMYSSNDTFNTDTFTITTATLNDGNYNTSTFNITAANTFNSNNGTFTGSGATNVTTGNWYYGDYNTSTFNITTATTFNSNNGTFTGSGATNVTTGNWYYGDYNTSTFNVTTLSNFDYGNNVTFTGNTNITTAHSINNATFNSDFNGTQIDNIEASTLTITGDIQTLTNVTATTTNIQGTANNISRIYGDVFPQAGSNVTFLSPADLVGEDVEMQTLVLTGTTDTANTTTGSLVTAGGVGIAKKLYVGSTITEASSIAYKENVKTIEHPLSTIEQLRGVTYEWKDKRADGEQIGLIAEEVKQILPHVTNGDGVSYTKLIGLLVEGIKELKREVDNLKNNK